MGTQERFEDYLQPIKKLLLINENGIQINFAAAALLVQDSAICYGRRVDILYNLAQQLMQRLHDHKPLAARLLDPIEKGETNLQRQGPEDPAGIIKEILQTYEEPPRGYCVRDDIELPDFDNGDSCLEFPGTTLSFENSASGTSNYRLRVCPMSEGGFLLSNNDTHRIYNQRYLVSSTTQLDGILQRRMNEDCSVSQIAEVVKEVARCPIDATKCINIGEVELAASALPEGDENTWSDDEGIPPSMEVSTDAMPQPQTNVVKSLWQSVLGDPFEAHAETVRQINTGTLPVYVPAVERPSSALDFLIYYDSKRVKRAREFATHLPSLKRAKIKDPESKDRAEFLRRSQDGMNRIVHEGDVELATEDGYTTFVSGTGVVDDPPLPLPHEESHEPANEAKEDQYLLHCKEQAEKLRISTSEESQMNDRVQRWHDELSKILEQQRILKPFDLRKKMKTMISSLEFGECRPFKEIVSDIDGKEKLTIREVAHSFFTSLQLAASGSVQLFHDEGKVIGRGDQFTVKLISKSRVFSLNYT